MFRGFQVDEDEDDVGVHVRVGGGGELKPKATAWWRATISRQHRTERRTTCRRPFSFLFFSALRVAARCSCHRRP